MLKSEKRIKQERNRLLRSAIKYAAELAILLTAAFFALNDALFHIAECRPP